MGVCEGIGGQSTRLTPHLDESALDWLAGLDIDDLEVEMQRDPGFAVYDLGSDRLAEDVWGRVSRFQEN